MAFRAIQFNQALYDSSRVVGCRVCFLKHLEMKRTFHLVVEGLMAVGLPQLQGFSILESQGFGLDV